MTTSDFRTAMIDAAKTGNIEEVRRLAAADASLANARLDTGESPLMAALYRGHLGVVDALLGAGARVDVFAAAALGRLDDLRAVLERQPGDAGNYSYDGWTPLHLASFFGHRDAAELLLDKGADLEAPSHNSLKNRPLHAAVAGGHVDVSLSLIEHGAAVDVADAGGHTPLHIAAEGGYAPVVKALLGRGADPLAVDAEDKTPLARAAARHHTAVVDLINENR